MAENPDRALEVVHGWPETSPENAREQEVEVWGGLRAVSWIVAVVSASVLVGGGIGMLGGVTLGVLNPFALGIVGAVVGIGVLGLFAVDARGAARRPWWRRWFGG